MENGYDTPSIIQLAGEDLSMNPFEFSSLANTIFKELELNVTTDDAYYQYALGIARQVIKGEMSAEKGFMILTQAAIDTNYHDAFIPNRSLGPTSSGDIKVFSCSPESEECLPLVHGSHKT